ncbi:mitochondrial ribosomal protein S24 [Carabus blaptoides fortunei]
MTLCLKFKTILNIVPTQILRQNTIHVSAACNKVQSGRYKVTRKRDRPLTYEMANPPHYIAHRKAWNSWNTSNLAGGLRPAETAMEDVFIRKFMTGTWHSLFVSEIIIKRQHNVIRIAGLVRQAIVSRETRIANCSG